MPRRPRAAPATSDRSASSLISGSASAIVWPWRRRCISALSLSSSAKRAKSPGVSELRVQAHLAELAPDRAIEPISSPRSVLHLGVDEVRGLEVAFRELLLLAVDREHRLGVELADLVAARVGVEPAQHQLRARAGHRHVGEAPGLLDVRLARRGSCPAAAASDRAAAPAGPPCRRAPIPASDRRPCPARRRTRTPGPSSRARSSGARRWGRARPTRSTRRTRPRPSR